MCFLNLFKTNNVNSTAPPTIVGTITGAEVETILRLKHPEFPFIGISDAVFDLCSKESLKAFLNLDETNKITYVPEKMDCDDFAARLYGQVNAPLWSACPIGLMWTNLHALCFTILDETKDFYYIEPQNDKIAPELDNWQGLQARFMIT